jgi:hypothetical protein
MCKVNSGGMKRKFQESALKGCGQQDRPTTQDHAGEEHPKKKNERDGNVTDKRR